MASNRLDLKELIENPPETLNIELKDWLDIKDIVVRASIAKHIAALANFGGGYLLFGFRDDRIANPATPFPVDSYNRDAFSNIVKKYLLPTFQCEVELVTSSRGITHPVVWVSYER